MGAIIDARDFMGKWYEAEIIAVQDWNGNMFHTLDNDNNDFLEIRKAKIQIICVCIYYCDLLHCSECVIYVCIYCILLLFQCLSVHFVCICLRIHYLLLIYE